jgi:hypothetical protein
MHLYVLMHPDLGPGDRRDREDGPKIFHARLLAAGPV